MGALIGLGFGIGLMLIWSVGALPRREGQRPTRKQHLRELLDQAGLESVSAGAFVVLALILGAVAAPPTTPCAGSSAPRAPQEWSDRVVLAD